MRTHSFIRRTRVIAGASLVLAALAPPAEAAPYIASCTSGVLAPQLCTFVASSVAAGFALPGQYLVLSRVQPTAGYFGPDCAEGRRANIEQYRGLLRGKEGVKGVTLRLHACPDAYPRVHAETDDLRTTRYGVAATVTPPPSPGRAARFSFYEGHFHDSPVSNAVGDVFRRNTGMSAYASGTSEECAVRSSNGLCEMGQRNFAYTARVDSSISGHWARLQLAVSSESSEVETRTARVTAQPHGSGGWKITRVA